MGFMLGDIAVDRVRRLVAENSKGLLYTLSNLSEFSINVTAETSDVTDAQGVLVKRFYRGKSAEITATNAMINVNIVGASSGSGVIEASEANKIAMPKTIIAKATDKPVLKNFVDGTVHISAFSTSGNLGAAFEKAEAASATAYAIGTDGTLTLPTADGVDQYIIKYWREVDNGIAIKNLSDKFPQTCEITIEALGINPCYPDELRSLWINVPSFQPSPELELTLSSEGTLNYSGSCQVNYCSLDKELFSVYWADEDVEG